VPFGVNMLGPVLIKYGNEAQKRTGCRASSTAPTGGARATRNRAPARTSRRSRRRVRARDEGDTTSSTARRRGRRSASTRT
jgi:hypothetical protein